MLNVLRLNDTQVMSQNFKNIIPCFFYNFVKMKTDGIPWSLHLCRLFILLMNISNCCRLINDFTAMGNYRLQLLHTTLNERYGFTQLKVVSRVDSGMRFTGQATPNSVIARYSWHGRIQSLIGINGKYTYTCYYLKYFL